MSREGLAYGERVKSAGECEEKETSPLAPERERMLRSALLLAAAAAAAAAAPPPHHQRHCIPATSQYGGYAVDGDVEWSADGASASAKLVVATAAQPALGADAETVVVTVNATCPDIVRVTLRPEGMSSHASELPNDLLTGDVNGGRPCAARTRTPTSPSPSHPPRLAWPSHATPPPCSTAPRFVCS